MKFDKEEIGYFIEDHKKKIVLFGLIGVAALGFVCYSVIKVVNKPEEIAEPEVMEEEIHVGGLDFEKTNKEIEAEIAAEKDEKYGIIWSYAGDVIETKVDDGLVYVGFVSGEGEKKYLGISAETASKMEKISGEYTLRGTPEPLTEKLAGAYFTADKRAVLDDFAKMKEYKTAWDTAFQDAKIGRGYKKNDGLSKIADDDLDLIYDEAYLAFETDLLSQEDSAYKTFMDGNPEAIRDYSNCMAVSDFTICDKNGEPKVPYSDENFADYFEKYWASIEDGCTEVLWNKGKVVSVRDILLETKYKNAYKEDVQIQNSEADNIAVTYADEEYVFHTAVLFRTDVRRNDKNLKNSKMVSEVTVPGSARFFYIEKAKDDVFTLLGTSEGESTLLLSNYYTTTDAQKIPEGIYLIENDTDFSLEINLDNSDRFDLRSGDSVLIDGDTYSTIKIRESR